jgi:hypothetical protein
VDPYIKRSLQICNQLSRRYKMKEETQRWNTKGHKIHVYIHTHTHKSPKVINGEKLKLCITEEKLKKKQFDKTSANINPVPIKIFNDLYIPACR